MKYRRGKGFGACLARQVQDFKASGSKTLHLDRRLRPVGAKHSGNNLLKSLGVKRRERNQKDDSIAASMILETTLDSIKKLQ